MSKILSVIIPTFNRSGFVQSCLTALMKCGVQDLEVIVVDDGGNDDTESVVRSHSMPALYFRQENSGPAAARNLGFRNSTGRYVAFLDCDDEWLPDAPAKALSVMQAHPEIDVLFADAHMGNRQDGFVSWIEIAGEEAFQKLPSRELEPGLRQLEREPFFRRMVYRNAVFLGSCLMKREAFESIGPFDPELCGAADWHLWLRMASRLNFAFWSEPMSIYTKHQEGMSNDHDGMSLEFCTTLKKLRRFDSLTTEQRAWVEARLRHHLFGYAYRAYNRGEFPKARRRFVDLLRTTGWEAKGTLYWLLSALPFGMAGGLRRLKHLVSGGVSIQDDRPAQSLAARGAK